jgi:hypothetical protein
VLWRGDSARQLEARTHLCEDERRRCARSKKCFKIAANRAILQADAMLGKSESSSILRAFFLSAHRATFLFEE